MNYGFDRAFAEVSLSNIAHNYKSICSYVKKSSVMGIVKCNAYGHGALMVARELSENGCPYLAVATIEEAVFLRENGIEEPLLVLGPVALENADYVVKYGVTLSAFSYDYIVPFSDYAARHGKTVKAHIKLDTGMSRYGIRVKNRSEDAVSEIIKIAALDGIYTEGIFSHMPCGDDPQNEEFNREEIRDFTSVCACSEEKGLTFAYRHIASSASVIAYPESHFDMVRPGIMLYGYFPDRDRTNGISLRPVMQLKTKIMQIKTLPSGTGISYNRTFIAPFDVTAAVVGIGYGDGVMRLASNQAHMLVHGKPAKILGRICMDAIMIDITGIEGVSVGDTVTVFGEDSGASLPLYDYLDAAKTISYEFLTGIGSRIPRLYYKDGKVVARQDDFSKVTNL